MRYATFPINTRPPVVDNQPMSLEDARAQCAGYSTYLAALNKLANSGVHWVKFDSNQGFIETPAPKPADF